MSLRIGLLGASGQLGCALQTVVPADWQLLRPNRAELELTGPISQLTHWLDAHRPEVLINAAADNAVEQAETEPDRAHQLNTAIPLQLAAWATQRGAYLIHFSSDYVFAGNQSEPIEPDDPTEPRNAYGRSKAAGEKPFQAKNPPGVLIRTSAVFGQRNPTQRDFNFIEKILNRAERGQPFSVRNDLTFNPTWANDLARFTVRCIQHRPSGVLHCTSAGATTWFDWAQEILRQSGHDPALAIPTQGDPPGQAKRPRYTVLACTHSPHGTEFTPWKIALQSYLTDRRP